MCILCAGARSHAWYGFVLFCYPPPANVPSMLYAGATREHYLSACCAITTGMPVSEQNCHPFQWGRYLFMHNGECLLLLHLQKRFFRRPVSFGVDVSALARLPSLAGLRAAQYNPSLQSYHPCVGCLARRPERLAFTPVSRQAWWAGSCASGARCWQRCPMPPMTLCRCCGSWSSCL